MAAMLVGQRAGGERVAWRCAATGLFGPLLRYLHLVADGASIDLHRTARRREVARQAS